MATLHNIPVDEPTEGHKESRNCPCRPDVQMIGGGRHVYHQYMNKVQEEEATDGGE
jgi:hypothetical protein